MAPMFPASGTIVSAISLSSLSLIPTPAVPAFVVSSFTNESTIAPLPVITAASAIATSAAPSAPPSTATTTTAPASPTALPTGNLSFAADPPVANFASCASFPNPWDTTYAPQAFWPPQVPVFPGRACIGYPNHYMMECCSGARDYICGWEVCMGGMSDGAFEACFGRLAERDGHRGFDDSEGLADVALRRRGYSFTCASAGVRSSAPSGSGRSAAGRAVGSAVVLAVVVGVSINGV